MNPTHQPMRIAITTSDSPDLMRLGSSEGHLKEAMAELAIHLLAADTNLVYGGDLRAHGFTGLLYQLVARYTRTADLYRLVRVTNHLAWPVHIQMPMDQIDELDSELRVAAELVLLECDGTPMEISDRRNLLTRDPSDEEWLNGLTAMREYQCSVTDGRVLLGGQPANYRGRMPGVAEEALLSLRARQPLFLIGGFGGCTRDIAEALGLADPWSGSRYDWEGLREFELWSGSDLNNGLSTEESEYLAGTPFFSQAIVLVLRGVHRLRQHALA